MRFIEEGHVLCIVVLKEYARQAEAYDRERCYSTYFQFWDSPARAKAIIDGIANHNNRRAVGYMRSGAQGHIRGDAYVHICCQRPRVSKENSP